MNLTQVRPGSPVLDIRDSFCYAGYRRDDFNQPKQIQQQEEFMQLFHYALLKHPEDLV